MFEITNKPQDKLALREQVATRAIAWSMYGDPDRNSIRISDEEYERCETAAKQVFADLDEAGLYED